MATQQGHRQRERHVSLGVLLLLGLKVGAWGFRTSLFSGEFTTREEKETSSPNGNYWNQPRALRQRSLGWWRQPGSIWGCGWQGVYWRPPSLTRTPRHQSWSQALASPIKEKIKQNKTKAVRASQVQLPQAQIPCVFNYLFLCLKIEKLPALVFSEPIFLWAPIYVPLNWFYFLLLLICILSTESLDQLLKSLEEISSPVDHCVSK